MQSPSPDESPDSAGCIVSFRVGVLVVSCALLAFLPAIGCGFVIPNDRENFQSNLALDYPWGQKLAWAGTTRWMEVYQPLWWVAVSAQHAGWKLNPAGYHAVSLALHGAVAAFLFALTRAILSRLTPGASERAQACTTAAAGLASVLFCVHPLRTEQVVWLSSQGQLFSVLCAVAGAWAYVVAFEADRSPRCRLRWLAGCFALGSAALFFNTSAVTFPLILLLLDWYPLRRLRRVPSQSRLRLSRETRWALVEKTPLLALSLVLMVVTRWAESHAQGLSGKAVARTVSARLADAAQVVWFYPYKTLVPVRLSAFYPRLEFGLFDLSDPHPALSAAAVLATCTLAWSIRRRYPGLTAAWLAYLIILAPHSGLFRFQAHVAADRYSYAASIPWVLLLAAGLAWLIRERTWGSLACWVLAGPLVIGLSILSWYQTATWRHSLAVWSHALASGAERSMEARLAMGNALDEAGQNIEALEHYIGAVEIDPESPSARLALISSLARLGNRDAARHELSEFFVPRHDDPHSQADLGKALMFLGEYDQAATALRSALQGDRDLFEAQRDLGLVLALRGDRQGAIRAMESALQLRPDDPRASTELRLLLAVRGSEIWRSKAMNGQAPSSTSRSIRSRIASGTR